MPFHSRLESKRQTGLTFVMGKTRISNIIDRRSPIIFPKEAIEIKSPIIHLLFQNVPERKRPEALVYRVSSRADFHILIMRGQLKNVLKTNIDKIHLAFRYDCRYIISYMLTSKFSKFQQQQKKKNKQIISMKKMWVENMFIKQTDCDSNEIGAKSSNVIIINDLFRLNDIYMT